jgi:hypothetical protein
MTNRRITSAAGRLLLGALRRPAMLYLMADEPVAPDGDAGYFRRAWAGLLGLSLAWGLLACAIWGVAWAIFRRNVFQMPAAAVLAAGLLGPMRRSAISVLDLRGGRPGPGRSVSAAVLVAAMALALMALEPMDAWPESNPLPQFLWWLLPAAKLYRALLLMPVWGAWAMLIAPQFCRPAGSTDAATASLARGCGALTAAACLSVPLAGTLLYFHYLGTAGQIILAGSGLMGAIAAGLACCRLAGGLCRGALLAANLLAQLAFLVVFLACQHGV